MTIDARITNVVRAASVRFDAIRVRWRHEGERRVIFR
jgi:hypothetical protein